VLVEQRVLGGVERASAGQEPHALGRFETETTAASGHHVDHQLGVPPRVEL
jgi:hypothetical protein